jgi:hypothetical protein
VESGVPFCPACGTPQIRVTLPAKVQSLVAAGRHSPEGQSLVSALPMGTPIPDQRTLGQLPPAAGEIHWSNAFSGAAVAGLVLAMALALPLAAPFLVMLVTGALSQAMYARRTGSAMTPGMGARTGMLGGLFGWGLIAGIFAMELALGGGRLIATLHEELQKQIAANPDPNAQAIMSKLTSSPNGMITVVVFGLVLFLVISLAVSAAGGALGARLFGRKQ